MESGNRSEKRGVVMIYELMEFCLASLVGLLISLRAD